MAQSNTAPVMDRTAGLGGSDIAPILGLSDWDTAQQVWEEKLGVGVGPKDQTWDMERGNENEDWARRTFAKMTGLRIRQVHRELRMKPPMDCLMAHIDGHVVSADRYTEKELVVIRGKLGELLDLETIDKLVGPGVVEVKCPRGPKWQRIKREGATKDYLCQMAHYWGVTGWTWGVFLVFHGDYGLLPIFLLRDDALVHEITTKSKAWWDSYVLTEIPPPEPEPDVELPEVTGDETILRDESELWRDLAAQFREITAQLKEAKAADKEIRKLVGNYMGARTAIQGGNALIYYRSQKGKATFDKGKLAAFGALDPALVRDTLTQILPRDSHPKINDWIAQCKLDLEQFKGTGKPSRPLRPYFFREV